MFIMVEARRPVLDAFDVQMAREGIALAGFEPAEFHEWLVGATKSELAAIEGFLIGASDSRTCLVKAIRARSAAPVLALSEVASLDHTLALFASGADDVVRKPVHVREILARARAIRRREETHVGHASVGPVRVYFDGRDPEVGGDILALPRRERRILEFLASNRGRRVTKSQIFHSIYGLFDEEVEENVVESHVSKLRKKLRNRIGYDLIDSKRYLGYQLIDTAQRMVATSAEFAERSSAGGCAARGIEIAYA